MPENYHIMSRDGGMELQPTVERMIEVLAELEMEDDEHPDVALTHESEWNLGAFGNGLLVWENLENDDIAPRHMNGVSRDRVLELWQKLAAGKIAEIEAEPWLPGYEDKVTEIT